MYVESESCLSNRRCGEGVPSIAEDAPVESPEQKVEEQLGWRQLLLQQGDEAHLADQFPLLLPSLYTPHGMVVSTCDRGDVDCLALGPATRSVSGLW